ncbi:MAG: phosphatase PAP2 family protein [Pseudomonadota bacterium]
MRDSSALRRSSDAIWIVIAASIVALVIACIVQKVSVGVTSGLIVITTNAIMIGIATRARKSGWCNVADWVAATAQMSLLTSVLTALSYVLASTNLPLQDTTLIAVDRSIGVDWRSVIDFFLRQPWLMLFLNYAYASLTYQVLLFVPLVFLTGYGQMGWQFVLAWSIALAMCVMIFPFAPALGGYLHYQLEPRDFPEVRVLATWLFVAPFHALRDGSLKIVELSTLDGIITFPSYHASVAILLAWAASGIPYLRFPMIALNLVMLVSSVPIGGHYLVDVIAGSLVGVVSVIAARAWVGSTQPLIGFRPVRAEA